MLFLQATLTKCQIKLSQDSADSKQQTQVTQCQILERSITGCCRTKPKQMTSLKCSKMQVTKTQLVLVFKLIG